MSSVYIRLLYNGFYSLEEIQMKIWKLVVALNFTDDRQKKSLLLNNIDEEAYEVYKNLKTGGEDETYEAVITLLDRHFAPKGNISYERFLFEILNKTPTKVSTSLI